MKRLKIGLTAHDFLNWSGGIDFLWTVTDSLLANPRAETAELHLIVPDSGIRFAWKRAREFFSGKAQARLRSQEITDAFSEFGDRITIHHTDLGRDAVRAAATKLDLDILLPVMHSLGPDFPRPWLAYAYDFQHKYFPENFTADAIRARDRHFDRLLTEARAVIVNSRAAINDIAKFVPQATARVFALPFAPAPRPDWLQDRPEIRSRYKIHPPYFIVSNQFWAHKDHATAFEAFRQVAESNRSVSLVCTGSTDGSTDTTSFSKLLGFLDKAGIKHRVEILGLIPKRDQIELLKHSCALIQPTLFEGGPGGGAVYDSFSLRVPAIVSDIPVNRELPDDNCITFFPAGDAAGLAKRMEEQLSAPRQETDPMELSNAGRQRRLACG
ncbi:MAG TPA: glycosyltransferase family 1 protein, partial [Chthoniobacterales bacterium]|nr:glycosyltransferase family 1 protein [Chthoniobacterales bacterium]